MNLISKHIQSFFKCAGSECCYSVCLVNLATEWHKKNGSDYRLFFFNEQDALEKGIEAGFIDFNLQNFEDYKKGFFVKSPCDFLYLLTGKTWNLKLTDESYKCNTGEFEIDFMSKSKEDADKGIGHFVRPSFNPLQNSQTVKQGKIFSKRVFF